MLHFQELFLIFYSSLIVNSFKLSYNICVDQVQLKIVTPEREVFKDTCDMVTIPAPGGAIGILPHHARLMSKVSPGELKIKKGSKEDYLAVGEGFVEVENDSVTIMTDLAKSEHEIDEKLVEEAKQRAQEALAKVVSDEEYATTLSALEKSLAQLKVKRRHRSHQREVETVS